MAVYIYSVTLNYIANGSNVSGMPSSQTFTKTVNDSTSFPMLITASFSSTKPTRTGYTFKGWSKSSTGSSTLSSYSYKFSSYYQRDVRMTDSVYAVWQKRTYKVTYKAGANSSGSDYTQTKTYGTALTLRGATYTRTGYTQTGWATSDGGAQAYALGASYTSNSAVTLYPVWSKKTYTVTYHAGTNGTGSDYTQTKTHGTALTLRGATYTRSGYRQIGWAVTDGGAQTYALSVSYTSNAAITLYPVWQYVVSSIASLTSPVTIGTTNGGTVTITRQDSSFTHTVEFTYSDAPKVTYTNVATSQAFTIPNTWLAKIPSATSAVATCTVHTYSGSTLIGTKTATFTVSVASTVKPTITLTGTNLSDNSAVSGWDTLVQGYSTIQLSGAVSAGSGAKITSIVFAGESVARTVTYSGSSQAASKTETATSSLLKNSGSKSWTCTATDTRGRTTTVTLTRTIYAYSKPSISAYSAKRALSDGTVDEAEGTNIKASVTYAIASCNSKNSVSVKKIEYKLQTASSWSTGQSSATSEKPYTFGDDNINTLYNYNVLFTLQDAVGNQITREITVSSVKGVSFGLNGESARFGGPVQRNGLEIDWNVYMKGHASAVGTIAGYVNDSTGDTVIPNATYTEMGYVDFTAGTYQINFGCSFDVNTSGARRVVLSTVSGGAVPIIRAAQANGVGAPSMTNAITGSVALAFAVDTRLYINVAQTSGGPLNAYCWINPIRIL